METEYFTPCHPRSHPIISPEPGDLAGDEDEPPSGGSGGGGEIPFAVGDFVWAKTKFSSWRPGRVYDPSQVSDQIKNSRPKRPCTLVAYIGDKGYCSWCEPHQMKPLAAEFHQIVRQYRTRSFTCAVEKTVEEIGRSLKKELTCPCLVDWPSEMEMTNSRNRASKFTICNYYPAEFLDCLRGVALDVSAGDLLKATMLQSWVLALQRVCLSSDSFQHCRRLRIQELVADEIDLDHPIEDVTGEEEASVRKIVEISEDRICGSSNISSEKSNVDSYESYRSDFSNIRSTSASVILSVFQCAAADPLHLKWNKAGKIVREFFDLYRRSAYSRGPYFHAYQKHMNVCSGIFRRSPNNGTGNGPEESGHCTGSEGILSGLICDDANYSEHRKNRFTRKIRKDTASKEAGGYFTGYKSVEGKALMKKRKDKNGANGSLVGFSDKNELARKKRRKDGHFPGNLINGGCEVSNSVEVSKTIDIMETKDATASRDPAALLLTFGRDVLLPSMDDLIYTFIKFGELIEIETLSLTEVGCARVLFASSHDAEKAFNNQDKVYISTCGSQKKVRQLSSYVRSCCLLKP